MRNLQSLLLKYYHQEIDQICGDNVEEKDEQVVHEFSATYVAIRIPNLSLERILINYLPALIQYFFPRKRKHIALRNVIYGNTFWSSEN